MRRLRGLIDATKGVGCMFMIAVVIIFIIASVVMFFVDRPHSVNTPGSAYKVDTNSRIYYSSNATETKDGSVVLNGRYEVHKGSWTFYKGVFTIPANFHPKITENPEAKITNASTPKPTVKPVTISPKSGK